MSNLIVNGDFEASNVLLVGWISGPPTKANVSVGDGLGGSNAAILFAAGSLGFPDPNPPFIIQSVPTTIGTTYQLTFYFSPRAIDSNSRVTINGVDVYNQDYPQTTNYFPVSFSFVATTTTTTLGFWSDYGGNATYDDISLVAVIVCYSGESIVHTKDTLTGEIADIKVKDLVAGQHEVFNTSDKIFVPVAYNVVSGTTDNFILIKKDFLGPNKPSEDFYVTSGHPIMIDGVITKAKNIKGVKKVKVQPQQVYTICTSVKDKVPILINNLDVMAWKKDQWDEIATKKNILWTNNKLN